MGEIKIIGFKDVSWWHGFLHHGQFILSEVSHPHIWCSKECFEANVESLILLQNEHIVLVVPNDTGPPQIPHVFISSILYRYHS